MKTFNLETTKERRRELRKDQTDAERNLWSKLRNKRMGGCPESPAAEITEKLLALKKR